MTSTSERGSEPAAGTALRLTEGPVLRQLLALSWPVLVSMSIQTLFHVVDAIWVGRLGPEALAAVTTCVYATWILGGLGELLATGVVATAARAVGAGRGEEADGWGAQGLTLALLLAAALALFAPWAPDLLFRVLATEPEVRALGVRYLTPLLLCALPMLLLTTSAAILRARGDTRTALRVTALSVGLNILLDPVLILGLGPFPAWGVAGAAWATVATQSIGVALFYAHFRRHSIPFVFSRPRLDAVRALLRIGLPVTLNASLYSLVYLWFAGVAARIDTTAVALLGVGNRLESITYILAESLSLAAAAFVGQNLGAERRERALRGARWTLMVAFLVGTVFGTLFFWAGQDIFAVFSDDPALLERAGPYMRVLALCQGLMAVEVALYGIFAGAGYTLVPTLVSAVVHAARIPLASWIALRLDLGLQGFAWMITLTCIARSLWLLAILARGRWLSSATVPARAAVLLRPGRPRDGQPGPEHGEEP